MKRKIKKLSNTFNYKTGAVSKVNPRQEREFVENLSPKQKEYTVIPMIPHPSPNKSLVLNYYKDTQRCVATAFILKHKWIADDGCGFSYTCLRCGSKNRI